MKYASKLKKGLALALISTTIAGSNVLAFASTNNFALDQIKAEQAWELFNKIPVKTPAAVGVIDSGVDRNNMYLTQSRLWTNKGELVNGYPSANNKDDDGNGYIDDLYGWNFFENTNSAESDKIMHGTMVATLITCDNTKTKSNFNRSISVNPNYAKIAMMRVGNWAESTNASLSWVDAAAKAIEYAKDKNIKIVNISIRANISKSYVTSTNDSSYYRLKKAIESYDGLVVAATGNEGNDITASSLAPFPAVLSTVYDNVISVASTDRYDRISMGASNYGVGYLDIFAPGDGVPVFDGTTNGGSSLAAPYVSGVASLLLAYNPNLNGAQMKQMILDSADKLDQLKSYAEDGRRLNAYKALSLAVKGDLNLDGKVSVLDNVIMTKFLLGENVSFCEEAADMNGDGTVNIIDSIMLKNKLLNN